MRFDWGAEPGAAALGFTVVEVRTEWQGDICHLQSSLACSLRIRATAGSERERRFLHPSVGLTRPQQRMDATVVNADAQFLVAVGVALAERRTR